jgi:hypothetical protein
MLENHVGIKLSFSNQLGEELKSLINHIDQIESKILRALGSSSIEHNKVYALPVAFLEDLQRYLDGFWSESNLDKNDDKFQEYSDLLVNLTNAVESGSELFVQYCCGDATT